MQASEMSRLMKKINIDPTQELYESLMADVRRYYDAYDQVGAVAKFLVAGLIAWAAGVDMGAPSIVGNYVSMGAYAGVSVETNDSTMFEGLSDEVGEAIESGEVVSLDDLIHTMRGVVSEQINVNDAALALLACAVDDEENLGAFLAQMFSLPGEPNVIELAESAQWQMLKTEDGEELVEILTNVGGGQWNSLSCAGFIATYLVMCSVGTIPLEDMEEFVFRVNSSLTYPPPGTVGELVSARRVSVKIDKLNKN